MVHVYIFQVRQEHFHCALKKVCPSLHRGTEAIVDVRPVLWEDIGGLEDVKTLIKQVHVVQHKLNILE